jgi:hypothetical protein
MAPINIVLGAIFIASFYLSGSLAFPPGHHEGAHPIGNGPISGLSTDYYKFTCPQADEIVVPILKKAMAKEPRIAASLLRLLFHDCFVQVSTVQVHFFSARINKTHQSVSHHAWFAHVLEVEHLSARTTILCSLVNNLNCLVLYVVL